VAAQWLVGDERRGVRPGRPYHLFLADLSSPLASRSPSSSSLLSSSSSPSSSADSSSGSPSSTWSGRETRCQVVTKEEEEETLRLWRTLLSPPLPLLFSLQTPPLVPPYHRPPPTARLWQALPHLSSAPNTLLILMSSPRPTPCSSDPQDPAWQGATQRTPADTESPGKTLPVVEGGETTYQLYSSQQFEILRFSVRAGSTKTKKRQKKNELP